MSTYVTTYQYEHWGEKLQANSPPNGRSWTDHDPYVVVKTIATFNANKHVGYQP